MDQDYIISDFEAPMFLISKKSCLWLNPEKVAESMNRDVSHLAATLLLKLDTKSINVHYKKNSPVIISFDSKISNQLSSALNKIYDLEIVCPCYGCSKLTYLESVDDQKYKKCPKHGYV